MKGTMLVEEGWISAVIKQYSHQSHSVPVFNTRIQLDQAYHRRRHQVNSRPQNGVHSRRRCEWCLFCAQTLTLTLMSTDVWFYYPNQPAAIVFTISFGLIAGAIIYRSIQTKQIRAFFWVVMVGMIFEVIGFALRAAAKTDLSQVVGQSHDHRIQRKWY